MGNGANVNHDHDFNQFDNPGECDVDTELYLTKLFSDPRYKYLIFYVKL